MEIRLHKGDIEDISAYTGDVAIDTETQGLNPLRDRLCLVQLSPGDGSADLIQIAPHQEEAPNLTALLNDTTKTKLFHFARFDMAVLYHAFAVMPAPIYCSKIASRLARTYTDRHGLRDLVRELLDITLDKQQQSSDWAADVLTKEQQHYAASDVIHLHQVKQVLDARLVREGRVNLVRGCFEFLPTQAKLDLAGWTQENIFAHS